MVEPASLVGQMLDTTGDELPARWQSAWQAISTAQFSGEPGQTLQDWLEEVYFDTEEDTDFTKDDIAKVGDLVRSMLRLEPGARASVSQILEDPWFHDA